MRIGLNLLHAIPEIGGCWNYIQNLLSALAEHDDRNHYVGFVNRESAGLLPTKPNVEKVVLALKSRRRLVRIFVENTHLARLAHRYRLDCMHWFANTQGVVNIVPAVVTVYDLLPFKEVSPFSWPKKAYLRRMMIATSAKAALLLPMSRATAEDLHGSLGVSFERMQVVPPVVEDQFAPVPRAKVEEFRATHRLPRLFWLYVAHYYPHKNHATLFRAIRELKNGGFQPWPLVLRGDGLEESPEIQRALDREGLRGSVIFLPRLSRGDLPTLYSAASALVFPSLFEGGGIPVMEALACGCPATVSNIPPTHEFGGDAPVYFNPNSADSLADALRRMQSDEETRTQCRHRGFERASEFRAPRVVEHLIQAYRRAA